MQGEREVSRTLCVLEVNAWREIPVAVKGINKGNVLSLQDVVMQRVHVAPGRGDQDVAIDQVVGMVAQRFIPAGTAISPKWARPPLDVQQGNVVVLTYDGGGFTLSVHAEALNDGRVGDRVLVRVNKRHTGGGANHRPIRGAHAQSAPQSWIADSGINAVLVRQYSW